jgi:bifunctional UDP-N-acetylglucosamine pyrophosphorylase/glucosamine-1-phosphate N-acetyltransferase
MPKNFRMKKTCAVVLAAGKGTRMKSDKPKVLHELAGKPMLFYTLEKIKDAGIEKLILVIGYKGEEVKKQVKDNISFNRIIEYKTQPEQKGTGDAVSWGIKGISGFDNVLVVNGDDSAFYTKDTVIKVVEKHESQKSAVTFVTLEKKDPAGLGRVLRDKNGDVVGIVEEKDADEKQKKIKEVNAGFYVFDLMWLKKNINKIKESKVGEYYIVDLIRIAVNEGKNISVYRLANKNEWQGVNTKDDLKKASENMEELV